MQQTVTQVNEQVRAQEAQVRMLRVLTTEVAGAPPLEQLLVPARSLVREAVVHMKLSSSGSGASSSAAESPYGGADDEGARSAISMPRGVAAGLQWGIRREYKWYIFTDVLMVCQPQQKVFGGQQPKAAYRTLLELIDLRVVPSTGSQLFPSTLGSTDRLSSSSELLGGPPTPAPADKEARGRGASRIGKVFGFGRSKEGMAAGGAESGGGGGGGGGGGMPASAAAGSRSSAGSRPRLGTPSSLSAASIAEDEELTTALEQGEAAKAEKAEVLRLFYRGAEYKCWATSEEEMAA